MEAKRGLAAILRDARKGALLRIRDIFTTSNAGTTRRIVYDFIQIDIPLSVIDRQRKYHRVVAAHDSNAGTRLRRSHRGGRQVCEGGARARGRGGAVHPPYLGVADNPGKCRSVGAQRFDHGARPACARERRMDPRHRRPRRHAGAYQDHADGEFAADPGSERRTRARNVAGDLPDRASQPLASQGGRAAVYRRRRLKRKPAAERSAAGSLSEFRRSGFRRRQNGQLVLISTSLVSGRKKKPTTAVIDAKMIGYHRPA